tara:strand:+ start:1 stop:2262 length:2262 start_codon:yes stop_codon:yes gene_type:complete
MPKNNADEATVTAATKYIHHYPDLPGVLKGDIILPRIEGLKNSTNVYMYNQAFWLQSVQPTREETLMATMLVRGVAALGQPIQLAENIYTHITKHAVVAWKPSIRTVYEKDDAWPTRGEFDGVPDTERVVNTVISNCVHQLRIEEEENVMALLESFDLFLPNIISDATRAAVTAFCENIAATKKALFIMPHGPGNARYDCTICGKSFSQKCYLKTHVNDKHSDLFIVTTNLNEALTLGRDTQCLFCDRMSLNKHQMPNHTATCKASPFYLEIPRKEYKAREKVDLARIQPLLDQYNLEIAENVDDVKWGNLTKLLLRRKGDVATFRSPMLNNVFCSNASMTANDPITNPRNVPLVLRAYSELVAVLEQSHWMLAETVEGFQQNMRKLPDHKMYKPLLKHRDDERTSRTTTIHSLLNSGHLPPTELPICDRPDSYFHETLRIRYGAKLRLLKRARTRKSREWVFWCDCHNVKLTGCSWHNVSNGKNPCPQCLDRGKGERQSRSSMQSASFLDLIRTLFGDPSITLEFFALTGPRGVGDGVTQFDISLGVLRNGIVVAKVVLETDGDQHFVLSNIFGGGITTALHDVAKEDAFLASSEARLLIRIETVKLKNVVDDNDLTSEQIGEKFFEQNKKIMEWVAEQIVARAEGKLENVVVYDAERCPSYEKENSLYHIYHTDRARWKRDWDEAVSAAKKRKRESPPTAPAADAAETPAEVPAEVPVAPAAASSSSAPAAPSAPPPGMSEKRWGKQKVVE